MSNEVLTQAEAVKVLKRLGAKVKTMPAGARMSPRQADARIALRQIAALVVDAAQRCADLEAVVEREK